MHMFNYFLDIQNSRLVTSLEEHINASPIRGPSLGLLLKNFNEDG